MDQWILIQMYISILVYIHIHNIRTYYIYIYIYIHMTYQWIQWYTHNFGQCFFLWVPFFGFCGCQISGIFEWVRSSRSINTSILALQVKLGEGWRHEWILQPILCGKISHKLGDVSFSNKAMTKIKFATYFLQPTVPSKLTATACANRPSTKRDMSSFQSELTTGTPQTWRECWKKIRIPSDFDTFPAISVNGSRIPSIEHVPTKILKPGPKTSLEKYQCVIPINDEAIFVATYVSLESWIVFFKETSRMERFFAFGTKL